MARRQPLLRPRRHRRRRRPVHPPGRLLPRAQAARRATTSATCSRWSCKYASDLPMIPLVLTSVAANPHMGIQVWMLGAGRAIPRNYYHTVINDAKLDWINGSQNYNDVIIAATAEAPDKHSFVTEYAGAVSPMQERAQRARPLRRRRRELAAQATDVDFVQYLLSHQFPFTAQTVAVLQKYIPMPATLASRVRRHAAAVLLEPVSYWLGSYRQQNPSDVHRLDRELPAGADGAGSPGSRGHADAGRGRDVRSVPVPDAPLHDAVARGHEQGSGVQLQPGPQGLAQRAQRHAHLSLRLLRRSRHPQHARRRCAPRPAG